MYLILLKLLLNNPQSSVSGDDCSSSGDGKQFTDQSVVIDMLKNYSHRIDVAQVSFLFFFSSYAYCSHDHLSLKKETFLFF